MCSHTRHTHDKTQVKKLAKSKQVWWVHQPRWARHKYPMLVRFKSDIILINGIINLLTNDQPDNM